MGTYSVPITRFEAVGPTSQRYPFTYPFSNRALLLYYGHPQKSATFVLDFVNDAEEIVKAFAPFYEEARAAPTDPNELFDARE